jgi:hypothetical protein
MRAARRKKEALKIILFFVVFNSFISLLINGMNFEAFFFFLGAICQLHDS